MNTIKKLCLMTIVGTRPEIIKMSAIIKKCDQYFNHILVHTGQNYDYSLNQVFFDDLVLFKQQEASIRLEMYISNLVRLISFTSSII